MARGIKSESPTERLLDAVQEANDEQDKKKPLDVLLEAHGLIRGERARHYGPPHDNFRTIAGLWSTYVLTRVRSLLHEHDIEIDDFEFVDENDVCNLMMLLKVAREASGQGYHRDSTVDAGGYAAIKEILHDYTREEFIREMS